METIIIIYLLCSCIVLINTAVESVIEWRKFVNFTKWEIYEYFILHAIAWFILIFFNPKSIKKFRR